MSKIGKRSQATPSGAPSRPFEVIGLSLAGTCDPGIPVAAARAGALGILNLSHLGADARVGSAVEKLTRFSGAKAVGVLVDARLHPKPEPFLRVDSLQAVILDPRGGELEASVAAWRGAARRIGLVVRKQEEAKLAFDAGIDFILAKGHESGGWVSEETTFVLLQRLLSDGSLPVYAWGGIGLHTAASCYAAGCSGVVLDWQLALSRESVIPSPLRRWLAEMDGTETRVVHSPHGDCFRFLHPRGSDPSSLPVDEEGRLGCRDDELDQLICERESFLRLWPAGQDACLAKAWANCAPSVGRAIRLLNEQVTKALAGAAAADALAEGGALARSHGTSYPVVQGPMTRVSDVPEFALEVARGGGLPFLALALMDKAQTVALLNATRDVIGDRPWGVGILGFVDRETREQQLEAMLDVRPPFALIAGGRADQARTLEKLGIASYLHVPSPAILESFLLEGMRRFVFEGRECGGHVGPRTSFILWEQIVQTVLDANLPAEEHAKLHLLFAGGIHDGRSAAMVAAMAQPLVDRGAKIGVLLGTAYLFTKEIVQTGALSPCFQGVVMETQGTSLLETGAGHSIRCATTDYVREFDTERRRLRREQVHPDLSRETLERMNLGRLRIAAKELRRIGQELKPVSANEQRREGMFMVGQVAGLRSEPTTVAALHREVCEGARDFLRLCAVAPAVVEALHRPEPFDVAIVGLACLLPGAEQPHQFWQNVMEGRDAITEIPEGRFDFTRWFDPDKQARDRIYSKWGGFLEDILFDPLKFGIPPASLPSIEPMQLLALLLVEKALADAGYAGEALQGDRTSVILGAGGGLADLGARYTTRAMLPGLVDGPDDTLYAQLPEWTEDSFAGILLNVISGRVSNRFDLRGVNFTVDAACASSLASVYLGCRELAGRTSDLVIAGGCDTVQNPLSYLCFSKVGALSPTGRSRAFDAEADGIVISEGLAAVVLKRREDAEHDGDRIYALIRAVAGSSDGRQRSLTAPSVEGQERALALAYEQARTEISTVDLIEAHGTGTPLGDPTECQALGRALTRSGASPSSVAIGSVKSMIGHTKAAAGVAGLIKATLAIHHRALPPTIHVRRPNPKADLGVGPLYVNTELRPWVRSGRPRRAGVSAFGFGGTNFHAVLEEYQGQGSGELEDSPRRTRATELFVFEGHSPQHLRDGVRQFGRLLRRLAESGAEIGLADLAWTHHQRQLRRGRALHRAALVAGGIEELTRQTEWLLQTFDTEGPVRTAPAGLYYTREPLGMKGLAFLFPGQGSQFVNMLRDLAVEFAEVRQTFERADEVSLAHHHRSLSSHVFPPPVFDDAARRGATEELKQTQIAQPALGACGAALLRLLEAFGVRPSLVAGHSYGELVALHAAGAFDEETLYRLSWERGEAMAGGSDGERGSMIAVSADGPTVEKAIAGLNDVWVANLNSPRQTILSGTASGLELASRVLASRGLPAIGIAVSCGFHSPLVAHARERFARALETAPIQPLALSVYNNATAGRYDGSPGEVRRRLADNLVEKIRFHDEIEAMYADGAQVFVEVGPGEVLTKLVRQILEGRPHEARATHPRDADAATALNHVLAALAAQGISVSIDRLFERRHLETLRLDEPDGAASRQPENHAHLWLVNGAYSRPVSEPPRKLEPTARLASKLPIALPPHPAAALPEERLARPTVAKDTGFAAIAEFQETMRSFLDTQAQVLEAFFGSDSTAQYAKQVEPSRVPDFGLLEKVTGAGKLNGGTRSPQANGKETRVLAVGEDIDEVLLSIVSERTGYPPEMLDLDSNLEADLGIDSIKRVEIIATCRRRLAPSLLEPPPWFMEEMTGARTLRAISTGIRKLIASAGEAPRSQAVAKSPPETRTPAELESLLLSIVAERTGYPTDMLELGSNLEADLSIDSIKRVEIIATCRRRALPHLESPPAWFMEQMAGAKTLGAILSGLQELVRTVGQEGPKPLEPTACPRCSVSVVSLPLTPSRAFPLDRGVVLISDDERELAPRLHAAIVAAGGRARILGRKDLEDREVVQRTVEQVRTTDGAIGAVVHLRPLMPAPSFPDIDDREWTERVATELKGLLYLLQAISPELSSSERGEMAVLSASIGGGDFGAGDGECRHPWRGGLGGLLKTAHREWPGARFRALDFDTTPDESLLLRELCSDGPVEIGYRDARRLTVKAIRRELPDELRERRALDEDSVVLVTGGARGITARVVRDMASRTRAKFLLLGRTSLPAEDEDPATASLSEPADLRGYLIAKLRASGASPQPREIEGRVNELLAVREIRETLAVVRALGSEVVYRSCDVRDRAGLAAVLKELEERHGPVELLIHGAGVIEDKKIVDKTSDSFDRVLDTKLRPMLTFSRALDRSRLKRVVLFSSVAGFYGNAGQGDYAAANEILNRVAERLRRIWRADVVSLNWGPWAGAGMASPEVARQFESRGIGLVSPQAGCDAAWKEMVCGEREDVRVLIGPGPWVDEAPEPESGESEKSRQVARRSNENLIPAPNL